MFPEKLKKKLENRSSDNALRQLKPQHDLVDFSSNDYLGLSKSKNILKGANSLLSQQNIKENGATGSRLLSGNHTLYNLVETHLCQFHNSEASLIFNSGYDANIGFFSSVPQRGDVILYDEYIHASIRDGISMSNAKSYKFKHNNLEDLVKICRTQRSKNPLESIIYIVTESVFSMDGDIPDLMRLSEISKKYNTLLVIDEAHAIGVFGKRGEGLVQQLQLEDYIFARIVTFGKAMGCHGAAILGSNQLKSYLVNFCRPFIYTTALPPHSIASIKASYHELNITENINTLNDNITFFKSEIKQNDLESIFIDSSSAIHCCIVSGNDKVKAISKKLQQSGFDVKAILSPTVPKHKERLRFCLHSYNSKKDISEVLKILATFINT